MHSTWLRRSGAALAATAAIGTTVLNGSGVATAATRPPLTSGQRIVRIAHSLVGDRYTFGGASPRRGFDCSGLTLWAYERARVATLPHNAQRQRYARHMHRIPRRQARPGDLIFYLDRSGYAYHVAIFAGHGWQYAAATPSEGVVHQHIWSRAVQFATDWH